MNRRTFFKAVPFLASLGLLIKLAEPKPELRKIIRNKRLVWMSELKNGDVFWIEFGEFWAEVKAMSDPYLGYGSNGQQIWTIETAPISGYCGKNVIWNDMQKWKLT